MENVIYLTITNCSPFIVVETGQQFSFIQNIYKNPIKKKNYLYILTPDHLREENGPWQARHFSKEVSCSDFIVCFLQTERK